MHSLPKMVHEQTKINKQATTFWSLEQSTSFAYLVCTISVLKTRQRHELLRQDSKTPRHSHSHSHDY
jgi:hypothetical protein